MGLDIYFEKRKNDLAALKKFHEAVQAREDYAEKTYKEGIGYTDDEKAEYRRLDAIVDELNPRKEIGYFRKVNFLMDFFNYEGNCEYKEIPLECFNELKERCEKVLADHSLADELLPTQSGFFFGSTDYDEWYFKNVEAVRDFCQKVLNETEPDEVIEMYCWW